MCGKQFAGQIVISSEEEEAALVYTTLHKDFVMKQKVIDGKQVPLFYVPGGQKKELNELEVDEYIGRDWAEFTEFDAFIEAAKKKYEVSLADDWKNSTCTCPQNTKRFMCKHVLFIAFHMGIINLEHDYDQDPLVRNKRRGAPKKATRGRPLQSDK